MARLLRILIALSATAAALVPSWQQQLDRVFLDIDMKPRTRSRTLFKVLGVVRRSYRMCAALSSIKKGFKDGHGEAIDLLFPKGTIIRGDLEGLQSLQTTPRGHRRPPQDAADDHRDDPVAADA